MNYEEFRRKAVRDMGLLINLDDYDFYIDNEKIAMIKSEQSNSWQGTRARYFYQNISKVIELCNNFDGKNVKQFRDMIVALLNGDDYDTYCLKHGIKITKIVIPKY